MKTYHFAPWLAWSLVGVALLSILLLPVLVRANGLPITLNSLMLSLAILAFCVVGALIVTRQPTNAIGWIFCATAFGAFNAFAEQYGMYTLVTEPGALPGGKLMVTLGIWLGAPAWDAMFSFTILLFPTGRLPSPRWRPVAWFAATAIAVITIGYGLAVGPVSDRAPLLQNPFGLTAFPQLLAWVTALEGPLILTSFLASVVSLIVRYRWAHSIERQQIKWFVYATAAMLTIAISHEVSWDVFGVQFPDFVFGALLILLPVSVGIAILRYRLFDIDLIIRRTLLYTLLSLLLALLYFGSVVVLETLWHGLTGQGQNQVVTVLSTLIIAALFIPLRQRVQAGIDRRFYRRRYDAEQILAAFGETVRHETDLQPLTDELLTIVQETLQPTQVSLWLAKPQ